MIDVLVSSKHKQAPAGLEHLPWEYELIVSDTSGWAKCSNDLLDSAAARGRDALFIDDDVTLTEDTFNAVKHFWGAADVFGVTLCYPSETEQVRVQSSGYQADSQARVWPAPVWLVDQPAYLAHVTASCMLIKADVLKAGVRFPVWPGVHSEDVAFTYDVWLHGFRVAYMPGLAFHNIAQGVGATKRHDESLQARLTENKDMLTQWIADKGVRAALARQKIPVGAWPVKR
jgi:GT2 family glycosyltransferase